MSRERQILLVYNLEEKTTQGEDKDLIALEDTSATADHLYRAMLEMGEHVSKLPVNGTLENFRDQLRTYSPANTFIFSNCDGFNGVNIGSVDIVCVIEELGFEHSGAPASAIQRCTDKTLSKDCLTKAGIPTPAYQIFEKPSNRLQIKPPVIIKPCREDGSVGIDFQSVAKDARSALQRAAYIIEKYHQPALVEEFIHGRELSLSLWGNTPISVLPISEQDFSAVTDPFQRVLTYDSKWLPDSFLFSNVPTSCPALLAPQELSILTQTAKRVFESIGLRDYGRVDFRLQDGIPWVIDVNDIPDLSPESGFPFSAKAAGYSYIDLVKHLLEICLQRIGWL